MSLINDALKRANQVAPPEPPTEESQGLEPVEAPSQPALTWPVIVFPILVFFIIALAAFFLVRGLERKSADKGTSSQRLMARERASSPEETEPVAPAAVEPVAAVAKQTNVPIPQSQTPAPAVAEPAPKPAPSQSITVPASATAAPVFKLHGIFFHAKKPSALINSQTLYVGDRVGNARVVAIEKSSVTIEVDGQRRVLTL
jgi:hypothetical protein